ncbi:MAG TPA: SCO family protein [Pyrinomonadaceae bacterium]
MHKRTRLALLFCLLSMLASCQPKPAARLDGKRYELKGEVVSVDREKGRVTISHEEIKGYMDAMTMPFELKDPWPLDVMKPGDEVQATLVVTNDAHWLEEVVVIQKEARQAGAPATASIPQPGVEVPDFRLVNQDGKTVSLKDFRGRVLLLTFIYTRCPLPDYCTLMSTNFAELDQELRQDSGLYAKTHLLSISFDPEYDTPQVLRSYGAAHTGRFQQEKFEHWEFASGDAQEIKRLAQFFGLTYIAEKDQIIHSLQTALIAPDGRLYKLYSGNEWKPADILADIRTLLNAGPN